MGDYDGVVNFQEPTLSYFEKAIGLEGNPKHVTRVCKMTKF